MRGFGQCLTVKGRHDVFDLLAVGEAALPDNHVQRENLVGQPHVASFGQTIDRHEALVLLSSISPSDTLTRLHSGQLRPQAHSSHPAALSLTWLLADAGAISSC